MSLTRKFSFLMQVGNFPPALIQFICFLKIGIYTRSFSYQLSEKL